MGLTFFKGENINFFTANFLHIDLMLFPKKCLFLILVKANEQ